MVRAAITGVHGSLPDYVLTNAELAALVFLPPGREVLAGVMAAAPEGPGFRVTFHDLRIT